MCYPIKFYINKCKQVNIVYILTHYVCMTLQASNRTWRHSAVYLYIKSTVSVRPPHVTMCLVAAVPGPGPCCRVSQSLADGASDRRALAQLCIVMFHQTSDKYNLGSYTRQCFLPSSWITNASMSSQCGANPWLPGGVKYLQQFIFNYDESHSQNISKRQWKHNCVANECLWKQNCQMKGSYLYPNNAISIRKGTAV